MRNFPLFVAAALLASVAAQASDIYRWKDDNGLWHYSDQPVPGAERVASASRPGARSETPPRAGAAGGAGTAGADAPPAAGSATQKVREDVATAKAAKCKEMQDSYQQTLTAQRLYKVGANGEREYLSEQDTEAARVAARSSMEYYCGK